jgi:hypothetical protein
LCENSEITVGDELVGSGGITINCANSNTCIIKGDGSNRLLKFTGDSIVIEDVEFQNGKVDGNVSL